jgi:hypothetical protein
MMMDDAELQSVANGRRTMTEEEREWAISQHEFLWEYVRTQDRNKRNLLTDAELANEIQSASWDYVRSIM